MRAILKRKIFVIKNNSYLISTLNTKIIFIRNNYQLVSTQQTCVRYKFLKRTNIRGSKYTEQVFEINRIKRINVQLKQAVNFSNNSQIVIITI